jgi:hypothetical protein
MKRLNDLTKKERFEYITSLKLKNDKHKIENAEIRYLFDNNTEAEIREWLETKAATISFEGADLISVYMHNRISEMLKKGEAK